MHICVCKDCAKSWVVRGDCEAFGFGFGRGRARTQLAPGTLLLASQGQARPKPCPLCRAPVIHVIENIYT